MRNDGFAEDGHHVEGEIYRIPDEYGLTVLDALEGNGQFYKRRVDRFIDCDAHTPGESRERSAWVYYILRPPQGVPQVSYDPYVRT